MNIIEVSIEDRTSPISEEGLNRILVLTKEANIPYAVGEKAEDFTGVSAGGEASKALEAIFAQSSQRVSLYGDSTSKVDTTYLDVLAKEDYFFIIPVGFTMAELEIIARIGMGNGRMVMFTPSLTTTVAELVALSNNLNSAQVGVFAHKGTTSNDQSYLASAITGLIAPKVIGSSTWALKSPNGVSKNYYTSAEEENLRTANINYVTDILGRAVTWEGTGTNGDFLDVTRSKFWLKSRMISNLTLLFLNRDKVPFTATGKTLIEDVIQTLINVADGMGILIAEETTITVPNPNELLPTDKAKRQWTGIEVETTLQGAVHSAKVKFILNL